MFYKILFRLFVNYLALNNGEWSMLGEENFAMNTNSNLMIII